MTKKEAEEFIEIMEEFGDVWDIDMVMDTYGDRTLTDAIADRKALFDAFGEIISTVLNR